MSLLDRKLARDLFRMRGQAITMALVVAAGVAIFVASVGVYRSLTDARDVFYSEGRFPDLFAPVKRAPLGLIARIEAVPGVADAEGRAVQYVILDWPASKVPVGGRIVSMPGPDGLGRLRLRRGVWPEQDGDILISEGFAEANGVVPGDRIGAIMSGRLQSLRITGIALSPEYVFAAKPGVPIPDDRTFAVIWMKAKASRAALGLEGAFNDLAVDLAPGADEGAAIAAIDAILEPYGSGGAIGRADQPSHRFLTDELRQQRLTAETVPLIFVAVAAFLLNVALGRLVAAQREQIASLKALGFETLPIALHYLKFVAVIVALGGVVGVLLGIGLGRLMILSYRGFFHFPDLAFRFLPWSASAAILLSLMAAAAGVWSALWRVVRLAPAEAMRPAAPFAYARLPIERAMPRSWRPPRRAMVFRAIAGRPLRTVFTIAGLAFALPLVVLGLFWRDAVDHLIDVQFNLVQRGDAYVTFPEPVGDEAVRDIARMDGVLVAEGQRNLAVRLRAGHRSELAAITGLMQGSDLNTPQDERLRPVAIPREGLAMNARLAAKLGLAAGDTVTLETLEGARPVRTARIAALVEETLGQGIYADLDWLNRLMGDGRVVGAVALQLDPAATEDVAARFKDVPALQSLSLRAESMSSFFDKVGSLVLFSALILTIFACIIAVGVVYNSVRVTLQERAWELATLRVLGLTRGEVSALLLTEIAIVVALAIPLGIGLAQVAVSALIEAFATESFHFPATIQPRTFALAAGVVIAASLASALVVRRRIDRLDLVAVLKARE